MRRDGTVRQLDGNGVSPFESPKEIGQRRERENRQSTKQVFGDGLTRGRKSEEVHADVPKPAGHCRPTRLNLGGGSHPRDQHQTSHGPNRLQSLPDSHVTDSPTNENRRAVIEQPANVKIENRETANGDERRIRSRQKDIPARQQYEAGYQVRSGQQKERGESEDGPRRTHTPGLEVALLDHRPGKIVRSEEHTSEL